ncbi:hypothetical protein ACIGZH_03585 [Streptomyces sp. NPDC058319]|uniref:hypothetical protein n=1 Tax=unclassified Streptomyces TaxID=2593676 RepID=UPI0036E2D237
MGPSLGSELSRRDRGSSCAGAGAANAALDAGEERGERVGRFGFGGGDPGRERQLVDVGAGDRAGEFGEQSGVREDWRREEADRFLAGGGVAVVSEVRGGGVREPGVDVGLDVPAGSPGELVSDGFVSDSGFGLLQGAELAQRLERSCCRGRLSKKPWRTRFA